MKKILITVLIIPFALSLHAQKVKNVKLKTMNDSISYALGISIADNWNKQNMGDLNPLAIGRAFQDFYKKESKIETADANEYLESYFQSQNVSNKQEEDKLYEENKKKGEEFLATNSKKEGVITLESGLQYKIIKEGTGNSPSTADKVEVHYEGTLIDGTKFDSSYDRKESIEFGVTQVIKGWTEALQLMKEGSIWMVYIPQDLAYGSRNAGETIKPFSTLIFKVELISVITE